MNYTLKYCFVYSENRRGMFYKKWFKHREDLIDYIRTMLSRNIGFCVIDVWYRDNYLNNAKFFNKLLEDLK